MSPGLKEVFTKQTEFGDKTRGRGEVEGSGEGQPNLNHSKQAVGLGLGQPGKRTECD